MNPETSLFKGNELAYIADILSIAKTIIFYYEFFKNYNKFDYKGFVFDINDLFQEFLLYFSRLFKKFKINSQENNENAYRQNEEVIKSLITSIYRKRSASFHPRNFKNNSLDYLNYTQSSIFNTFIKNEDLKEKIMKHETKSIYIQLKSRKITLDENEINKILNGHKKTEKSKYFRILPDNLNPNEEYSAERSSLHLEKNENKDNFLDNDLFESIFKSKTVFHKQMSLVSRDEIKEKELVLPKLATNKLVIKERKKEKTIQNQLMLPFKAENFKYMKQVPNLKSFKNLQSLSTDYLNRFILKKP